MKRPLIALFALTALAALATGCAGSRVEDTAGSVILSVSDFDGLPVRVSVNSTSLLQIDSITIQNLPKDPFGQTSQLMDVEMRSYQVTYTRVDSGSRAPTPLVRTVFGVAPVGGTVVYDNLVVMSADQLRNAPLTDLLVGNGGIDSETGSQFITLELTIRFYGRTIAGDDVATDPIRFDVEFTP